MSMTDIIVDFLQWVREGRNTDEHPNLVERTECLAVLRFQDETATFEIMRSGGDWVAFEVTA